MTAMASSNDGGEDCSQLPCLEANFLSFALLARRHVYATVDFTT